MQGVPELNVKVSKLFLGKFTVKDGFINILAYICVSKNKKNTPMASRRKLKSTIKFVSSELITDIYFRCLMSKDIEEQKVNGLVEEIMTLNREFILRANRPDGKDNPKLVKTYFRKLFADWQVAMEKVIKSIENL